MIILLLHYLIRKLISNEPLKQIELTNLEHHFPYILKLIILYFIYEIYILI